MTEYKCGSAESCKYGYMCRPSYDIGGCSHYKAEEPQTNEEWRKTCSAEEFAEWISNLAYACMRCGMSNGEAYCHTGYCIQDEADAEKWLKEKHNEM